MHFIHGRRLAVIRRDRRLTQVQLAAAIGLSPQSVSSWEKANSREVRRADAEACARALGCRVEDLAAPPDASIPAPPRNWVRPHRRSRVRRPNPPDATAEARIAKVVWTGSRYVDVEEPDLD